MKRKLFRIFPVIFFTLASSAQVPVREEPRHKVALQNAYIRLLDVHIAPGDTSLFHVHEIPSFFIPLSTTATGSQVKGQAGRASRFPLDSTWYNGFENGPLVHRVWNTDTNVLHVIDLELLAAKNSILPAGIELPFKIDFENEKLRVYKCELTSHQTVSLPLLKTPMLFVSLAGEEVQIKQVGKKGVIYKVSAGGFQWLDPQKNFHIMNPGKNDTRCILILLK